jgi:hypothetical protein
MKFGGGQPKIRSCQPMMWVLWAALALLICCQKQPSPPPIEELVSFDLSDYHFVGPRPDFFNRSSKVDKAYSPPRFAYYRVWIEQDGERWPFTIQTQDTLIFIQLLQSDSLCIEVGACNSYGEYGYISRADVYRIQPDTLQCPLEAPQGTSYNWIVIPQGMQPMPARASDLASAIHLSTIPPTPCWTVSEWNATAQTFTHYTTKPISMGDFNVYPGRAYRIEVAGSCSWKPTVRRATREGWTWQRSEDDR